MIVYRLNNKWDMVKFLDLQAITMRHGGEIKAAIDRVVESGWFLQGNENKRFEMDYAKYIGTEFCVTVANGLDALKLILRGYKEMGLMQDGDEIIVPANTYIATILAITDNNLVPVLVEPTWDHLEINIDAIEEHITSKTKGPMVFTGSVTTNRGQLFPLGDIEFDGDCGGTIDNVTTRKGQNKATLSGIMIDANGLSITAPEVSASYYK